MHDLARVLYESMSQSFGITTQLKGVEKGLEGKQVIARGAIAWDEQPQFVKAMYRKAADDLLTAHGENAIERDRAIAANAPRPVAAVVVPTPPRETETFVCSTCGASMMKGENHDCKAIVAHRRALGHRLPGDT